MVYILYLRSTGHTTYKWQTVYDNAQEAEAQARQMNMAAQSPVALVRPAYAMDAAPLYVTLAGPASHVVASSKTGFEKFTRYTMVGEVKR